jgi:predicted transcriptional regulator
MSNEPTNTEPTRDEFTPDSDEVEYPSTLRITSVLAEQAQAAAIDRVERWEEDEEVPHVVNFEDRTRLRQLLTNRRMELLETVMDQSPESIRALADRLERDVHDVHDDLYLLAE